MTLRQKMLLRELPKNGYNIKKTAKSVGYSEYTADSSIYNLIRNSKAMKGFFSEETVKKELNQALKKCKKKADYTNVLRSIELMSKILGMQLDKSEVTNKNPDKIVVINKVNDVTPSNGQ